MRIEIKLPPMRMQRKTDFFLATGVHPKNNRDECFQRTNTHLDPKQCQRSLARWLATQMVAGRQERDKVRGHNNRPMR